MTETTDWIPVFEIDGQWWFRTDLPDKPEHDELRGPFDTKAEAEEAYRHD